MNLINTIRELHRQFFEHLERLTEGWLLGSLARIVFALTLLVFFVDSAISKFGEGFFGFIFLDASAYVQIVPKAFEAAGYNPGGIGTFDYLISLFGTWAEFILPLLIVIGLFTRVAALSMIGFTIVMSIVDVVGHGVDATAIGMWFDHRPDSPILDQRTFWIFLFIVLAIKGPGKLSLDAVLARR